MENEEEKPIRYFWYVLYKRSPSRFSKFFFLKKITLGRKYKGDGIKRGKGKKALKVGKLG
jgi:hypothetical protein